MNLFILSMLLLSHSTGNSSSCSSKIDMALKYPKNVIYKYENKISVSSWEDLNKTEINTETDSFTTILHPYEKDDSGYKVYEVVTGIKNSALLDFVAKYPPKLPLDYYQQGYPVGIIDKDIKTGPAIIKEITCNKVFITNENFTFYDQKTTISKNSINKIVDFDTVKINEKRARIMRLESRKQVKLEGKLTGTGTETTTLFLISGTNELYEQRTQFLYTYKLGVGKERKTFHIKGEYLSKLDRKEKYSKKEPYFPALTEKNDLERYYTNKNGLYTSVKLDGGIDTKMYIIPTSDVSIINYDYYYKNLETEPENYLQPFKTIEFGSNKIENPPIQITSSLHSNYELDYKTPGVIGMDILKLGELIVDDNKRQLVFWEPDKKDKKNKNAVKMEFVNGSPIFELTVNGSIVKATISLDTEAPEISYSLKNKLNLTTIKVAIPKGENIIDSNYEKADIIITPPDRDYFKTSAVIRDFGKAPYDIKLGTNYIKNKKLTINYKDSWFSIE